MLRKYHAQYTFETFPFVAVWVAVVVVIVVVVVVVVSLSLILSLSLSLSLSVRVPFGPVRRVGEFAPFRAKYYETPAQTGCGAIVRDAWWVAARRPFLFQLWLFRYGSDGGVPISEGLLTVERTKLTEQPSNHERPRSQQ